MTSIFKKNFFEDNTNINKVLFTKKKNSFKQLKIKNSPIIEFTYNLQKKISSIYAVRLTNYNNVSIVLTIYYPYLSIIFGKDKILKKMNTNMIYESDEDHQKKFHKKSEPYDWHIHIKVKKTNLNKYLDYFNKKKYISTYDKQNILNLCKQNNIENISIFELQGSNSLSDLKKFRFIIEKLLNDLNVIKYDRTQDCMYSLNISNYVIRICNLDYKTSSEVLKVYYNLCNNIKTIYLKNKDDLPKIKFKILYINPKYKKNYLVYLEILKSVIFFLNPNFKPKKTHYVVNFSLEECKYNIFRTLIYELNNFKYDLNLLFMVICFIVNNIEYKEAKDFILFKQYIHIRNNIQFAWSIFQLYKCQYLNLGIKKYWFKILKEKYNCEKTIDLYLNICSQKILLNSKTDIFKLLLKSKRQMPLN
jgi:hypothetical protein